MSISYEDYLQLGTLLSLQKERAEPAAEDEPLFITIHQAYELWFKQLLYECAFLSSALRAGNGWAAAKKMRRVLSMLKLLVHQTDILETMTPRSFAQFRDFLEAASGLQSYQFRELEIVCGWRHRRSLYEIFKPGSPARKKIEARLQGAILWEDFYAFLVYYDKKLPALVPNPKAIGLRYLPSAKLQTHIVDLIPKYPEVDVLTELFVDFDEGLQEWRYRHVKMVERTIGNKTGTGGTRGVDYLKATLHRQFFPDLWEIRSRF